MIMENVKLVFTGTERSETERHELICYATINQEILIGIEEGNYPMSIVYLNKETAVRLSKELKKQIGYIES